jgi:hypothetical protein
LYFYPDCELKMNIFDHKKRPAATDKPNPALRGRTPGADIASANPLARRFAADDEPDTIDLGGAGGFPADTPDAPAEPETRVTAASQEASAASGPVAFLAQDPGNGKFYVLPGSDDVSVLLGGEVVMSRTELRRGDRIRIGNAEFEFLL